MGFLLTFARLLLCTENPKEEMSQSHECLFPILSGNLVGNNSYSTATFGLPALPSPVLAFLRRRS
jgi:hypothetical protein